MQGERARGEVLHMGMEGCSAAPIGCFVAQIQGGVVAGGGGVEDLSVQGECARRVCKASMQGGKVVSVGIGGLFCSSHWFLWSVWVLAQSLGRMVSFGGGGWGM